MFQGVWHHPANYLLARLQMPDNTCPLLLGNIANLFLDEWIHAEGEPDYLACMKKHSVRIPLNWLPVPICATTKKEREFFC